MIQILTGLLIRLSQCTSFERLEALLRDFAHGLLNSTGAMSLGALPISVGDSVKGSLSDMYAFCTKSLVKMS